MATHSSVLPEESKGWGSLVGCHLWGSHRVRYDWSDLAAAAAAAEVLSTVLLDVKTKVTYITTQNFKGDLIYLNKIIFFVYDIFNMQTLKNSFYFIHIFCINFIM